MNKLGKREFLQRAASEASTDGFSLVDFSALASTLHTADDGQVTASNECFNIILFFSVPPN